MYIFSFARSCPSSFFIPVYIYIYIYEALSSTSRLCLKIANWSASRQLGFLSYFFFWILICHCLFALVLKKPRWGVANYVYISHLPKTFHKIFRWVPNSTEAKSYLKLVTAHFSLIGQVQYGVFSLVVQALNTVIQQINHYTVDKCWGN